MKVTLTVVGTLAVLTAGSPAIAFDQAAAQQACGNDVYALCQQAVPDQNKIAACMQRHIKQVSVPCRRFMAATAPEMSHQRRGLQRRGQSE
jgi:hypothetical protein